MISAKTTLSAFLITATAVFTAPNAQAASGKSHWGYSGHEGPDHWAELAPNNSACAGTQQSPINIQTDAAVDASKSSVEVDWHSFKPEIVNNGHTIQVNTGNHGGMVSAGGREYQMLQFHFHHLSEHTIDGKHGAMEAHFVHKSAQGDLFVVGVMINEGDANPVLGELWKHIPKAGHKHAGTHEINPYDLMPGENSAFRYHGSLTTPPCSEIVTWHVMAGSITASKKQIEAFKALYPDNYRPVQQANRRIILYTH